MQPTKTTINSFEDERKTSTGKYAYVPRTDEAMEAHEHAGPLGVGYTVYEFGNDVNGRPQRKATGYGPHSETFDWTTWDKAIIREAVIK